MSLETLLTEMIAALKENTAAHLGKAAPAATGTKATTTKAATEKAPAGLDAAGLKALAVKVMEAKGKPFAKKLIKDTGGAVDLANVKPEKFAALAAAFEKAMSEEAPADEAEPEDEL